MMPDAGACMFIIVRHGNTFEAGEPARRIGSRTDLPLTAQGKAQADALGRHFASQGIRFARAFVSPLLRTRQTADAILEHRDPPAPYAEPADFLREIDHGPDENQTEESILARIGTDALAQWDTRAVPPPGWQVDPEARLSAWRKLFANGVDAEGPVLLVTSNGAARFALLADPGLAEAARAASTLKLPTGGYGVIARGEAGALELQGWGIRP